MPKNTILPARKGRQKKWKDKEIYEDEKDFKKRLA